MSRSTRHLLSLSGLLAWLLLAGCDALLAHPLAPGLLDIEQLGDNRYQVTWKRPALQRVDRPLQPELPEHCRAQAAPEAFVEGTGVVQRWPLQCSAALTGSTLGVRGLQPGETGVLLRVASLDGGLFHHMLSAEEPRIVLPARAGRGAQAWHYLSLGIEHLVTGIDHVLFVLALTLLMGWGRKLVWAVTFFTIGHSLTLALAVLGWMVLPEAVVETLIAFSIVVAAAELLRGDGPLKRRPWLMSGLFGLLHGMGFATALSGLGLPKGEIPLALASFNIGIEIGQLLIIAAFLLAWRSVAATGLSWQGPARHLPACIIGTVAAIWFWQRLGADSWIAFA